MDMNKKSRVLQSSIRQRGNTETNASQSNVHCDRKNLSRARPTIDWEKGVIDWHLDEDSCKIEFLAVGDILVEGSFLGIVEDVINTRGGAFLFAPFQPIFLSADIVMGNLENPLSNKGDPIYKIGPNFRASPKMAKVLRKAGFTVLGVANNHIRDYGDLALIETLEHLQSEGLVAVGVGRNVYSAMKPAIVRIGELSVGIFAFTYRQESVAHLSQPGAADLDDPKCFDLVREFSSKVDAVIVSLHMDTEYSNYPAPYRIRMAHKFIDMGAEMVIGHHPHVPQGLEIYKGKLIAYSLGNFTFHTQRQRPLTSLGYILRTRLTKNGTASAAIIPYKIGDCFQRGHSTCQAVPLSNRDRENAMRHLRQISSGLSDQAIASSNWSKIANKEAIMIIKHIVVGILRRKPYTLWLPHLTLLRYRAQEFLKGFVKFNRARSLAMHRADS